MRLQNKPYAEQLLDSTELALQDLRVVFLNGCMRKIKMRGCYWHAAKH